MKNYETLVDALYDLHQRGYKEDFATPNTCLYCGDLDIRFNPDAFHIDEVYRFNSNSKLENSSILFAITTTGGIKGIVVDDYDRYAENLSDALIKKLHWNTKYES